MAPPVPGADIALCLILGKGRLHRSREEGMVDGDELTPISVAGTDGKATAGTARPIQRDFVELTKKAGIRRRNARDAT